MEHPYIPKSCVSLPSLYNVGSHTAHTQKHNKNGHFGCCVNLLHNQKCGLPLNMHMGVIIYTNGNLILVLYAGNPFHSVCKSGKTCFDAQNALFVVR